LCIPSAIATADKPDSDSFILSARSPRASLAWMMGAAAN
jgi:hypothetical protein